MEKFSNWRDKGTGITPFIQSNPRFSLISLPVILVKLPIFIFLLPLALLNISIIKSFILKFLFNFESKIPRLNKDLVYITNYSSPLLAFVVNLPINIPIDKEIQSFSTWTYILHSLGYEVKGKKVKEMKRGILLIEGTPSNNKCILKFETFDTSISGKLGTLIVKFQPNWVNTPVPTNPFSYLIGLMNFEKKFCNIKVVDHRENLERCKRDFDNSNLKLVNFGLIDKKEFWKYKLEN
ncbi:lysophosphatidic acid:oleoyl-CoA acyltransferase 1 [[Candida] jaroonii]|uniref:Lysophosphatidic acid:oleoyl-CoA acyltransferase 1 n=1 Tax=[Candida] jaroonii TaxID=467808 RepID=A0ACA9YCJ4_9ASCO|nr:lysophosphatidic acid:oleoyl-CoA acyltransferase 1 [[Candida] jaroonii]